MVPVKAVVQQIGARMDYAVPLALHSDGRLARLVTDLHLDSPLWGRRLRRYSSGVPAPLISRDNMTGLSYRAALATSTRSFWPHVKISEAIAKRTIEAVRETGANVVYGFDTAMLPSLDRLRETGVMIVIEQCIAPRAQFVAAMERMRHSLQERGLAIDMTDLENEIAVAQLFSAVEQAEWSFADRIYCPSKFVASALQEVGVVAAKTRLLPYGVSIDMEAINRTQSTHKPRVTFCGRFSWRKGALEFGALASALKADAQFEVLGQVGLPSDVIKAIAPDVQLRGHLNRADYRRTLAGSDLMVLPSYSEGSATVVYEAMAMGVPCVVSAEAGSVITHRQDGLIVSAGDLEGLIAAVASLLEDSVLRREIGQQAALTAQSYTRESYGARVVDAIHNDLVEFRSS